MKRHRFFGDGAQITQIARTILEEDIPELSRLLAAGWNINSRFEITSRIAELPISLALVENRSKVVKFLLDNGAELNDRMMPAAVLAARCCDLKTLELLISHGARITGVAGNAYSS